MWDAHAPDLMFDLELFWSRWPEDITAIFSVKFAGDATIYSVKFGWKAPTYHGGEDLLGYEAGVFFFWKPPVMGFFAFSLGTMDCQWGWQSCVTWQKVIIFQWTGKSFIIYHFKWLFIIIYHFQFLGGQLIWSCFWIRPIASLWALIALSWWQRHFSVEKVDKWNDLDGRQFSHVFTLITVQILITATPGAPPGWCCSAHRASMDRNWSRSRNLETSEVNTLEPCGFAMWFGLYQSNDKYVLPTNPWTPVQDRPRPGPFCLAMQRLRNRREPMVSADQHRDDSLKRFRSANI